MKKTIFLSLALIGGAICTPVSAQKVKKVSPKAKAVQTQTLKTEADSISYAAGYAVTNGLDRYLKEQFGVDESQMADVIRGFKEAYAKRNDKAYQAFVAGQQVATMLDKQMFPRMSADFEGASQPLSEEMVVKGFEAALRKDTTTYTVAQAEIKFKDARDAAKIEREEANKAAGEKFLAENKLKPGVNTLPDGLQYKVLVKGDGPIPKATDKVQVVYEGRTLDGKIFDATANHGKEFNEFAADRLIKGWTEALTMMPVGSKWEIYIPQDLAYGARGAGRDIAPYSALIFTLELKGIVPAAPKPAEVAPAAPVQVEKAPEQTPAPTKAKAKGKEKGKKKK